MFRKDSPMLWQVEPNEWIEYKEKNRYYILACIYRIWENGADEPTCRAGINMQT